MYVYPSVRPSVRLAFWNHYIRHLYCQIVLFVLLHIDCSSVTNTEYKAYHVFSFLVKGCCHYRVYNVVVIVIY